MNSGTITDQLLDAVQVLVDDAVNKAEYDKTVQAVIAQCVSVTKGQYTVKYQGGYFYAYSQDPDIIYSPETQVYVLIPGNDMSRTKTILGTVDKLGDNFTYKEEIASVYENTGSNICSTESGTEFELHSYKAIDGIILYEKGNNTNDVFAEGFNLDIDAAEMFLKKSDSLMIAANFRTALALEHRVKGNYGLKCILTFEDPITGTSEVDREYVLDINSMNGDPYIQISSLKQSKIEPIDSINFKYIKKIELFSKDFETTTIESKQDIADIFASNIEIMGVNEAQEDEKTGYILNLGMSPRGYFNSSDGDTAIIKTNASFFKKGLKQNLSSNDVVYYWFKEDASIEYNSNGYLSYGGRGWKCLNPLMYSYYWTTDATYQANKKYYSYNNSTGLYDLLEAGVDYIIGNNIPEESIFERDEKYRHGESYLEVQKLDNPARENKYKCVVVFKETLIKMEKEFIIYNLSSNYIITLTADVADLSDANQAILTCSVAGATGLELNYYWSQIIDNTLPVQDLGTTGNINTKTVILTNAIENILYKCLVKNGDQTIGYAELNIRRGYKEVPGTYYIEIHNDNQIFKYDADGNSPADETLINPQQIQPLTFTLYGPDGEEINHEDLGAIVWTAPDSNTMIDTTSGTTTDELIFTIKNKYNPNAVNNTINLRVNYNDLVIRAKANVIFLKEGDNGTNGTSYYLRLEPNYEGVGNAPKGRVYYYYRSSNDEGFNFTKVANEFPFKALFYRDGEKIYDSHDPEYREITPTITYSMLKRVYTKEGSTIKQDTSRFSIENNDIIRTGSYTISTSAQSHTADILRCTFEYDNLIWYYDYPIIYMRYQPTGGIGYQIIIPEEAGFNEIYYTADGHNPKYNGNHIFKIKAIYDSSEQDLKISNSYVQGHIYTTSSGWENCSSLIKKGHSDAGEFYAKEFYDGNCVTNAIYMFCTPLPHGASVAGIHFPIVTKINTYENKFINEWNGNAIELNEEGGIILTPQIAAGQKEIDNTFTGVVGGKAKESKSDNIEQGIFGYNHGERTFELSAETGQAKFGRATDSQIIITPEEDRDDLSKHSIIRSANYQMSYEKCESGRDSYEANHLYFNKVDELYLELDPENDYKINEIIQDGFALTKDFVYKVNKKYYELNSSTGEYDLMVLGEDYQIGSLITIPNLVFENFDIYRNQIDGSGVGLEIDLTDPHIRFGSGNFRVEKDGTIVGTSFITEKTMKESLDNFKTELWGSDWETPDTEPTDDTRFIHNKNYCIILDKNENKYIKLIEDIDYNMSYILTLDTNFQDNKDYFVYDGEGYNLYDKEEDYQIGDSTVIYVRTPDVKYLINKEYYIYNSSLGEYETDPNYEVGADIEGEVFERLYIYEKQGDIIPKPNYLLTIDKKYQNNKTYFGFKPNERVDGVGEHCYFEAGKRYYQKLPGEVFRLMAKEEYNIGDYIDTTIYGKVWDSKFVPLEKGVDYQVGAKTFENYSPTTDNYYKSYKQYYKKVNNQYIYMESGDDYEPGAAIEAYIETKDTTYQSGKNYYIYNSSLGIYELFEDYNIGDPIEGEIFEANFITYDTDVDVFEQLDIYDLVVIQDTNDKMQQLKDGLETIKSTMFVQTSEYFEMLFKETGIADEVNTLDSLLNGTVYYELEYNRTTDTEYQADKEYYIYNSSLNVYELFEDYEIGDVIEGDIFEKVYKITEDKNFQENKDYYIYNKEEKIYVLQIAGTDYANGDPITSNLKRLEEVTNRITFVDGNIVLSTDSTDANASSLVITKERISFMTGKNESAYISQNQLYITDSTILNKLQVGHWETKEDAQQNLNTRWVPDNII